MERSQAQSFAVRQPERWQQHLLQRMKEINQKTQSESIHFQSRTCYFSFIRDPFGMDLQEKQTHAELFLNAWKKSWQQAIDGESRGCDQAALKEQFVTFFDILINFKDVHQELAIDLLLRIKEQFTEELGCPLNTLLQAEHLKKLDEALSAYPKFRLLQTVKGAFFSAEQKYRDKIADINRQNSVYGFCLPSALRSHGSYGEKRVHQFIESIRGECKLNELNDKIGVFFRSGGGVKDHSFVSFVLSELKDLSTAFCEQIALSSILLQQEEVYFHDQAAIGLRTQAMEILRTQPFFICDQAPTSPNL